MLIQLQFENPLEISSSDPDKVKVVFEDTSLIYDFTGQQVEQGTFIEKQLPPQFTSKTEAKIFNSIEEAFEPMETGVFSNDIAINTAIAGVL